MMEIPDDAQFLEILGFVPTVAEYDPDIWQVVIPVKEEASVTLSFDIGARSVRVAKRAGENLEVEVYREQVGRLLLTTGMDGQGFIVECDIPGIRCELRVLVWPEFKMDDTILVTG